MTNSNSDRAGDSIMNMNVYVPQENAPANRVEVLTGAANVWVIAVGEYEDRRPVAVVHGTEADAERYVDRYNATHPWESEEWKAHVWCDVEYIAPQIQQ